MLEEFINKQTLMISMKNSEDQIVQKPLRKIIKQSLKSYLFHLDKKTCENNLYELVLSELEQPLLDTIMQYTRGNQTQASLIMGINRSTLRKKLRKYGMN